MDRATQQPHRLFTDGGARGNPGPAGIGAVLEDPFGQAIEVISQSIGWSTNNVAEYRALIAGLKLARNHEVSSLRVFMDSELVINQMLGKYRVKNPGLRPLYEVAASLADTFNDIAFAAIPREHNSAADDLVNAAIDLWLTENAGYAPPEPAQKPLF